MTYLVIYWLNRTNTNHMIVVIAETKPEAREAVEKYLSAEDKILSVDIISMFDARYMI